MDCLRIFDTFGYTPQFLIEGEPKYKSLTGGIISISFIILSLTYSVSEFKNFFDTIDDLVTSRQVLEPSKSYNISSKDIYFGIGLLDRKRHEYNLSMFPYLKFQLQYTYSDKESLNSTSITLSLGNCNISNFLSNQDISELSDIEINNINNKLKYYLCPDVDFLVSLSSSNFKDGDVYLQIHISLNNESNLDFAKFELSQYLFRTSFIFKNIFVNSEDRLNPFKSFIDRTINGLDYEYEKTIVTYLSPFEMADDNNLFSKGDFIGVESDYSDQKDNTIFLCNSAYNLFSNIRNRSEIIQSNNNQPLLSLMKLRLFLNPMKTITLRTYPKFTDFLAGLLSILSTGLMCVAIFMVHFNSIQGFNQMVQSLYTIESIKNMRRFTKDIKETIKNFEIKFKV